ncbi:ATP-binding cassette domain-containing protein, partial [Staphylococcus epidermidis]|uniref:ATP-binding cassette domain-containing protein n=1 Tax=Staphylococcus epidermidis TaxID=1282 RepID=UPI0011A2455F
QHNQFLLFLPPSPSPKSTTLPIIAPLQHLTKPTITINHKLINHLQPKHPNIPILFQNYPLYPHITVYKNLPFPLKIPPIKNKIYHQKIQHPPQILQIQNLLHPKPKPLSPPQPQPVALPPLILTEAQIFLIHQPLS